MLGTSSGPLLASLSLALQLIEVQDTIKSDPTAPKTSMKGERSGSLLAVARRANRLAGWLAAAQTYSLPAAAPVLPWPLASHPCIAAQHVPAAPTLHYIPPAPPR